MKEALVNNNEHNSAESESSDDIVISEPKPVPDEVLSPKSFEFRIGRSVQWLHPFASCFGRRFLTISFFFFVVVL